VNNREIIIVNEKLRGHHIEQVGAVLRKAMTDMKSISTVA
jgi:ketol-acid reductoisomerase